VLKVLKECSKYQQMRVYYRNTTVIETLVAEEKHVYGKKIFYRRVSDQLNS
jgi:hypothetical protein